MKMMNKTTLAVALAAAMGTYLPEAGAIVKLEETPFTTDPRIKTDSNSATLGGAVIFAAEQSGESTLTVKSYYTHSSANYWFDGDLSVAIPVPGDYEVTGTKTLFVRVTLTGGAKFAAEPQLVCPNNYSGGTVGLEAAAGGTFANIADGSTVALLASAGSSTTQVQAAKGLLTVATTPAINKTTATFNIVSGFKTTTNSGCLLTFKPAGAAGLTAAYTVTTRGNVGMAVEAGYIQGAIATTALASGVILSFKTALKAAITLTGGVSTNLTPRVTIDVKQASKKFEADATKGTTTTQALIGGVKVVQSYDSIKIRLATVSGFASTPELAPYIMSTATLTIGGPLVAKVKNVGLYGGTFAAGCQTVSTVPLAVPTTTTGGGNITLSNIPIATAVVGVDICANVDGNTTLDNGQLTAVLTGGGVSNFAPDLGAEANIVLVGINGARVRVLNIPPATAGDQAFIRFYNTSSQNAVVRGTLFGMDGKVLGTENSVLVSELKANSVVMLDAPKLAAAVGGGTPIPAWSGRAWLLVQAEIDKELFKVVGLLRTPTNILVNLSTDASN